MWTFDGILPGILSPLRLFRDSELNELRLFNDSELDVWPMYDGFLSIRDPPELAFEHWTFKPAIWKLFKIIKNIQTKASNWVYLSFYLIYHVLFVKDHTELQEKRGQKALR